MEKKIIYALGFFDGVHLGHQALLTECRRLAKETGCQAGIVTFTSHPDTLVSGKAPALINTPEERKHMLTEQFHMDHILELPFDQALMQMNWRDFIRFLRNKDAAGFVCGSDFRFGYQGEGNAEILRQYCAAAGLACCIVPEQKVDGIVASSTDIRKLLESGQMALAVRFLGHPHLLSGTVVAGRGLGHTIGIPTANLLIPEGVVVPKFGVYACKAVVGGKEYMAVTNVGTRPTVGGRQVTVEPWILDFAGDLYGQKINLLFYEFLRPEKKFDSLEELKAEIGKNALQVRKIFEKS